MSTAYITVVVAFVFLLTLWVAVGVRHLRLLKKNLVSDWEFVDEKIRARHDIVPFLFEVLKNCGASVPSGVIEARDKARRIYFAGADKLEKEYDLSHEISGLISIGVGTPLAKKDPRFLELKSEIEEFNKDIENRTKQYNDTVRKFNSANKNFILMPLSKVMRFKQALIFEFEK